MSTETFTTTGLWEGYTLSELKARSLSKLKQIAGNYDRYTEPNIEMALNDGLVEAVRITRCLHSFAIIRMKEGYSQYRPPSQMILPDKAFFYQSATSYYELEQKTRAWLDIYKKGWRVNDGDPLFVFPGDNWGNLRKIGVTPTPNTDGEDYASSPDTGIYASATGMTTTGNVTGINSTAHATICTDSAGRTLADEGITVGMMAVNVTDGSSGQISAVSGSTFTVTLTGGTADTWAAGDQWTVLAGEYGVVTDWENDEKYLFTADIGGMVNVSTLVGNVYLEFIRRPLKLQFDNQYPELPPDLHQYLPEYVVWSLKRDTPKGSNDQMEATMAKAAFMEGIGGYVDLETVVEDDSRINYNL